MAKWSSIDGTTYVVEGNSTGASDGSLNVRPARTARVSRCQSEGVGSGRTSSSGIAGLQGGEELPQDRRELVGLDEEGVVPVAAGELGVAGPHAGGPGQIDDLPRLVVRVEDVAVDPDRQQRGPQPGERRAEPTPVARQVVQVHGLGEDEVAVGVEAAHELVTLVFEVALDLEPLPQREAVDRLDDLAAEPGAEDVVAAEGHHRHHPGGRQALVGTVARPRVVVLAVALAGIQADGPPAAAPPPDL